LGIRRQQFVWNETIPAPPIAGGVLKYLCIYGIRGLQAKPRHGRINRKGIRGPTFARCSVKMSNPSDTPAVRRLTQVRLLSSPTKIGHEYSSICQIESRRAILRRETFRINWHGEVPETVAPFVRARTAVHDGVEGRRRELGTG